MTNGNSNSNSTNETIDGAVPVAQPRPGDMTQMIRAKILHILEIYPKLSHSMLGIGIGTAIPSTAWKEILEDMITEGLIVRDHLVAETPSKRLQTYTIYSLATYTHTHTHMAAKV